MITSILATSLSAISIRVPSVVAISIADPAGEASVTTTSVSAACPVGGAS